MLRLPSALRSAGLQFWATFTLAIFAVTTTVGPIAFGATDEKLAPPEDVILVTSDGVRLAVTYYKSSLGKDAAAVVLLHAEKGQRSDFSNLALQLQAKGFAVVAPDLRGHGGSTRAKRDGREITLSASTMAAAEFGLMPTLDMRAVASFVWQKNNAKELNIDKLCVVGAELGASVALEFAAFDAHAYELNLPEPYYGPLKLGGFVKALALISPEYSVHGISLKNALGDPTVRNDLSVLLMVGEDDAKAVGEAKRVYSTFEKSHPEPPKDLWQERKTLFYFPLKTKLQGTKVLEVKDLKADKAIAEFLDLRLVKSDVSKTWDWKERKSPNQ